MSLQALKNCLNESSLSWEKNLGNLGQKSLKVLSDRDVFS